MTRTNIVLDESLVGKAKHLTGLKTMREVVHLALRELVRHHRQKDILKLKGHIHWEGDLSEMRKSRMAR
ncbi:MAG: transcriptional regulator of the Arc/MetJ class [Omnitrophica bacterium RIFCSPHIGHO2_02_FULL_51_18]|nr:MAG: transcriptional regulator of the Arc/MetJ class [Omnitrophica bacterium RIFCSPHIGHO2_02_FULL_51_18]